MNIILEPEQIDLLVTLVEAARNVPRDKRQKFIIIPPGLDELQVILIHPELKEKHFRAYMGDIEILEQTGLVFFSSASRGLTEFDITPSGYRYYEQLKKDSHKPLDTIESTVKAYISGNAFQIKYPKVYKKWAQAEALLWESDTDRQFTTIGHLCREAMQEFTTAMLNKHKISIVDQNPAKTFNRMKAVIEHCSDRLGTREKPFLNALNAYWDTVIELVQRQEHGAQKEGEPLVWEDGRRVVFQTMMVMYELDRSLS